MRRLPALALLALALLALTVSATAKPPAEMELANVELAAQKAEFTTSEDVTVRFTLANGGRQPMSVYVWHTPLRGVENDLFVVTRDGEPVTYLGIVAKRTEPVAEDFVRLAPGQRRSVDVELSTLYDMSQPGNYVVEYRAPLGGPVPEGAARLDGALSSNGLNIRLTGEPRRQSPEALGAPEPLAAGVVYRKCSNSQIAILGDVLPAAQTYASTASSYVNGHSSGPRYETWFGAPDSTRWNTVKSHFSAISSALSTQTITFDCGCKKRYYAYVYPSRPYEIYLCRVFWDAPLTGTDSKAGTVIHETSHFNNVASTNDWVYGQSGCKDLAKSDPNKAVNNADSHEYYAENNPAQQ